MEKQITTFQKESGALEELTTAQKSTYLEIFKEEENLLKGYLHFGLKYEETHKGVIFGVVDSGDPERIHVKMGSVGIPKNVLVKVLSNQIVQLIEDDKYLMALSASILVPTMMQGLNLNGDAKNDTED